MDHIPDRPGCQYKHRLAGSLLTILLLSCNLSFGADRNELVLLTWSEYIDQGLLPEFEKRHQAKIKIIGYESDDMRDEFILETDATGYDIIVLSGIATAMYKKRGWIQPLDKAKIPNLKHIDKKWLNAFDTVAECAVPYFWGTVGIAYRKDLLKKPFTSWMEFYTPDDYLRGKIASIRYSRDLIGTALKALGYSLNSTDRNELNQAEQLLQKQKPYVKAYSYMSLGIVNREEAPALQKGTLIAAMGYNGDTLSLQESNSNIEFIVPKEGTNIWVDYLTVASNSKNKALAWKFINFLNEPEVAARNAVFVNYPTPNTAAEALLPESHLTNPAIYPGKEIIDKSEFYKKLPARNIKYRNAISAKITD